MHVRLELPGPSGSLAKRSCRRLITTDSPAVPNHEKPARKTRAFCFWSVSPFLASLARSSACFAASRALSTSAFPGWGQKQLYKVGCCRSPRLNQCTLLVRGGGGTPRGFSTPGRHATKRGGLLHSHWVTGPRTGPGLPSVTLAGIFSTRPRRFDLHDFRSVKVVGSGLGISHVLDPWRCENRTSRFGNQQSAEGLLFARSRASSVLITAFLACT